MGAVAENDVAVGQIEGPGIFRVEPRRIVKTGGDDFFETGWSEIGKRVSGEAVDAPDAGSGFEIAVEVGGVGDVLFRRDKELDPVVGEMQRDALDRDDLAVGIGKIGLGKSRHFFELAVESGSAENGGFFSPLAGMNPGAGVSVDPVATADEDRSVAVADDVSAAEPVAGAALERFHENTRRFLIDEGGGESGEFFGLNGGKNGHGGKGKELRAG